MVGSYRACLAVFETCPHQYNEAIAFRSAAGKSLKDQSSKIGLNRRNETRELYSIKFSLNTLRGVRGGWGGGHK